MSKYTIRGGEEGKARLNILARALAPTTRDLLQRVGIRQGMHCLDLGCGGGNVTMDMARLVGSEGKAVGIDMDSDLIELARQDAAPHSLPQLEFQTSDVQALEHVGAYDIVYARCLLTHLKDPGSMVQKMRDACKPGGTIIVEDIDLDGHFGYPRIEAFQRYVELNQAVMRKRGADPNIGPKLPELLRKAGITDINVNLVQQVFMDQDGKSIAPSTCENTTDAIVNEGLASSEEMEKILADLKSFVQDPDTLVVYPRIFQAWGQRD